MRAAARKRPSSRAKARSRNTAATQQKAEPVAAPRVISRKYLSPPGVREISSKRLTAAIKAVKEAHASADDVEM